jgi:mono/diheme cytochrome c family protein
VERSGRADHNDTTCATFWYDLFNRIPMKRSRMHHWMLLSACLLALFVVVSAFSQDSVETNSQAQIERGRYLVNNVAKCIECHTPRDEEGRIDRHRLLEGAPIPVSSPFSNRQWAFRAPAIAGLPGWSRREAVYLLMHGRREGGQVPRGPMPQFGMSREDAEAVVSYLLSLHSK